MKQFWIIAIQCLIFGKIFEVNAANLTFPAYFEFGIGSSSYQIEGAWNVSGRGESIWDYWTHNHPELIKDGSNGDDACQSYYKYKEDVQLVKALGLDIYRFSPSWSRILPTGYTNVINEEALQYYKNLTAELLANDITPYVTIYHFDHPQFLEDMGGWTNELIVDRYVEFARILFESLGDSVKMWSTVNAPETVCGYGYERASSKIAPGKELNKIGIYRCGHNVLKAHAKTYHMYDEEFRPTQQGKIGFVSSCSAHISANETDLVSAETAFAFTCGWMNNPIYIGDYPEIMKTRIATISEWEGYPRSRLPEFSQEWIDYIKGTSDYFGLNHYSTLLVSPDPDEEEGIYNTDMGLLLSVDPSWKNTTISWLKVYPPGFRYLLNKIKDEYNNPLLRVMENGFADTGGSDDYDRINYFYGFLEQLLISIQDDGCDIRSYSIWSLMDSFEWDSGYASRLGLYSVDFDDDDRPRTPKLSASWFTEVLATRVLQPEPTQTDA